jgi:hypothetical protein
MQALLVWQNPPPSQEPFHLAPAVKTLEGYVDR